MGIFERRIRMFRSQDVKIESRVQTMLFRKSVPQKKSRKILISLWIHLLGPQKGLVKDWTLFDHLSGSSNQSLNLRFPGPDKIGGVHKCTYIRIAISPSVHLPGESSEIGPVKKLLIRNIVFFLYVFYENSGSKTLVVGVCRGSWRV